MPSRYSLPLARYNPRWLWPDSCAASSRRSRRAPSPHECSARASRRARASVCEKVNRRCPNTMQSRSGWAAATAENTWARLNSTDSPHADQPRRQPRYNSVSGARSRIRIRIGFSLGIVYGATRAGYSRFVAIGDSQTEGLWDGDETTGLLGFADRLAVMLDSLHPGLQYANLAIRGKRLGD